MKNRSHKLIALLLAMAMILTMGSFSFVLAEEGLPDQGNSNEITDGEGENEVFDAQIVSAEWVKEKVAEITFDQDISLGDDIKNKVQYQGLSFLEKYLGANDTISVEGNVVTISVPNRVSGGDLLYFHPGALIGENGAENTELITVEAVLDKRITKAVYTPSRLGPEGGSVSVRIEGKNLYTSGEFLTVKICQGEEVINTITLDEWATAFSFNLPANSGSKDKVYTLNYLSSKYEYNAKPVNLDEGVGNTIVVEGLEVAADPVVSEISFSSTQLKSQGGKVTASIKGEALSQLEAGDFSVECDGEALDPEAIGFNYKAESDETASAEFVLPANESSEEDVIYTFNINRGAEGIDGNGQEIRVLAVNEEPLVESITYDKNSSDLHGGETLFYMGGPLHATLKGDNLDKLTSEDFMIQRDGAKVNDVDFRIDSADETGAVITFTFPENDREKIREYKVTMLRADESVVNRVLEISIDARPQDSSDKFRIDTDKWDASEMGEGVIRVLIDPSVGAKLALSPDDYKHYEDFFEAFGDKIWFADTPDGEPARELTAQDQIAMDGSNIIISLADTDTRIPYYVIFGTGALENKDGLILGNDEYGRYHNRYIKKGAHIDSISYNKITFDSKGGDVVATVSGTMLNESEDTLDAKVFVDSDKQASENIVPEVTVADDGKSAEFRFSVPANKTDMTVSYKLTPVVNGTNAVPQYIKGYDVIAVLPEGAAVGDTTLSSVEIQGAYDMDDRLDVFRTSTSAEQFTTKIDAVIRGTELSSKKTSVRAIDENGVIWPMLPVFECGATIRWQSSSTYLPEKASRNEQRIELLIPRRLGVTREFTLQFAPDGKNYLTSPTATVIVENEGLYDEDAIGNGTFERNDFTELKDIEVKYVDGSGNQLAASDHYKGYGITELYHQGIGPKKIEGYTVVSSTPRDLEKMLTPPVQHESGEYIFTEGQWFVKDLRDRPIVYTYEKDKTPAPAKITSPKTSIKKVIKGKKSFTVKWKKQTKASGYEIQYSLKKNFKKAKTVKIKKNKTTKKVIKKLKSKKTYYVRIRTFKKSGGKRVVSGWSKRWKVKTR